MRTPLLALLLGCSTPPERYEDCEDAACRQRFILEDYAHSPDEVVARLVALADPVEQEVIAVALVERYPGQTSDLCPELLGPAARRCKALNVRPHLTLDPQEIARSGDEGRPEGFLGLMRDADMPEPWSDAPALTEVPCAVTPAHHGCYTETAIASGGASDYAAAASACQGIEEEKWRHECFFQVAEKIVTPTGNAALRSTRVAPGVGMCQGAGPYRSRCLLHLANAIGERAPAADQTAPAEWKRIEAAVEAGAEALGVDAGRGTLVWRDQAGSTAAWTTTQATRGAVGNPLDATPAGFETHYRAALAYRVLELEGQEVDLSAAISAVEEALAARATGELTSPRSVTDPPLRGRWERNLPGEDAVPWVTWLRNHRRATSPDPSLDLVVALTEAAGMVTPPRLSVLRQAVAHEDALVRWAAVRVLSAADRTGRVRLPAEDPDPLVQGRLP